MSTLEIGVHDRRDVVAENDVHEEMNLTLHSVTIRLRMVMDMCMMTEQ